MSVYCPNCGMELPDWARFCERCGTRLSLHPASGDPLDELDDLADSEEPLWDDADADADERDLPTPTQGRHALTGKTLFLAPAEAGVDLTMPLDEQAEDDSAELPMEASAAPSAEDTGPVAEEAPSPSRGDARSQASDKRATAVPDRPQAPVDGSAHEGNIPLRTIDVGDDDGWPAGPNGGYLSEVHGSRTHSDQRIHHRRDDDGISGVGLLLAAMALAAGFLVAYLLFGRGSATPADEDGEQTPVVEASSVAREEASRVIAGLDGWWKTDRTLDGRYWHMQDGLMETFGADGKLAAQVLIDPASVTRMDAGPGGVEGAGYYLRDIAFYLRDEDADTLHAINIDGSADEDANLMRCDPPAFVSTGEAASATDPVEPDESEESEYVLPDSATRVYDASELEGMSDHDLFLARNEIYARHGYVFEAGELSRYFAEKSWYHPSDVFNEGEIGEIERQNVSTILSIEQARGSRYV